MSETSGEKREKDEAFYMIQETGVSRAKRWLEGGHTWGVSREVKIGIEKEKEEKRGERKEE